LIKRLFRRQSDISDVEEEYQDEEELVEEETEEETEEEIEQEIKSSIEFSLNQEGDIDIRFFWKKLSPQDDYLETKKMATDYAVLMSLIDGGGFKNDMIKILVDSHKENTEENKFFIGIVLETLLEINKTMAKNLSKPLISPSKAFKNYEQK